jgi:hypothetical protein
MVHLSASFLFLEMNRSRSKLQTSQPYPSKNDVRDKDTLIYNEDGSYSLYFGPKAPAAFASSSPAAPPGS